MSLSSKPSLWREFWGWFWWCVLLHTIRLASLFSILSCSFALWLGGNALFLDCSITTSTFVIQHIEQNKLAILLYLTWMPYRIPEPSCPGLSRDTTFTLQTSSSWHSFGSSPFRNTFYMTRLRSKQKQSLQVQSLCSTSIFFEVLQTFQFLWMKGISNI